MFCLKCGHEIKTNQKYCSKCGEVVPNVSPKTSSKSTVKKAIIIISCIVLVIVIALSSIFFISTQRDSKDDDETKTTKETTTEEQKVYLDYFSNIDSWDGKYGFADLQRFYYCDEGVYLNISEEHLGVVSAIEYDCDNDGNNELITVSLLPTSDNKLYLSPAVYKNDGKIKKINSLGSTFDKLQSECPVWDIGNVDCHTGSFISVRIFIENGKLCILQGMYSYAKMGRGENHDNIYVYNLSKKGVELYRHYYLYEEEIIENCRSCRIGETTQNISYTYNMFFVSPEEERENWNQIKIKAILEMREDASAYGFDKHFATEKELQEQGGVLSITNSQIYMEDYFVNDELVLDCWILCDDNWNHVVESIEDYTKTREKAS